MTGLEPGDDRIFGADDMEGSEKQQLFIELVVFCIIVSVRG
jgi:hypothetical protein